jgi:hypothetical protein
MAMTFIERCSRLLPPPSCRSYSAHKESPPKRGKDYPGGKIKMKKPALTRKSRLFEAWKSRLRTANPPGSSVAGSRPRRA